MVCRFVWQEIMSFDSVFFSAIFCTSGAQAAVRAKEGFDMVRVPLFL
jgi:hypothetical protein